MSMTTLFELVFAAGVVVAAAALVGAALDLFGRRMIVGFATVLAAAAITAWVLFALEPSRELGVSAGGLTVTAFAAATALALLRALQRAARLEHERTRAERQLLDVIEREARERAAELERVLARARADSASLLAEQERRMGEERRAAAREREQSAHNELAEMLATTQKQVEQRLHDWSRDLDRSAEALRTRIIDVGRRQQQLIADAEARIAADTERLQSESEEQHEAVMRLRTDIQRALEEAIAVTRAELDTQSAERRRALHEINERLRRRERELVERIEREEAEAVRRIQASLGDVQRRQVEQLERAVGRAGSGFAEQASLQFAALIKSAREDAARRLARELDRAVASFAREAEGVLAERLAHVGDAGAQRIERRLAEITSGLDRQRDDFVREFERRLGEAEADLRRRLSELASDAEAERAILEARLQELARRFDEADSVRTG